MDTFYNEIQMREGIKVGGAMRDMQQPLNLATAAVLSSWNPTTALDGMTCQLKTATAGAVQAISMIIPEPAILRYPVP